MRAREIMSKVLFYCTPEETTERAAQLMREHDIGAVPVVNDCTERKLVGVLTDRDICIKVAAAGKSANAVRIADVMTRWPDCPGIRRLPRSANDREVMFMAR
jgi:CBS domain-containing protein